MSRPSNAIADEVADDPAERLDRFLTERVAAISASLPASGVPLDATLGDEVRTLEGLSHLRREHLRPEPRKRLHLVRGVFVLTAVIITALVFIPYQPLRAEMDIVCSAVTMQTATPVQLTGLTSLKILQGIEFAPTVFEGAIHLRPPLDVRPRENGSLTLRSITIPSGSRVSIQKMSDEGTWRLNIERTEALATLTLVNAVDVSVPGQLIQPEFGRGRPMTLRAATETARLELDVTPADAASLLVRHNVPITKVAFEEALDEAASENVGLTRGRTSSVIRGTIFNQSLGGRQFTLRTRETVEIEVEHAQVRDIRLESDGLHLNLSASARQLRVGTPGAMQTLNPSYVEWLAEHHALKLAWGAAAWLFAIIVGGMKWWQATDVR